MRNQVSSRTPTSWVVMLAVPATLLGFVLSGMTFSTAVPASSSSIISQLGVDIDGAAAGDESGWSVSLSADGSRVAIGARSHDSSRGHVRVFDWSGTSWVQVGSDIDGQATGDQFGYSVSLSADGSRVAIGAPTGEDGFDEATGLVRVFEWTGTTWVGLGQEISGFDDGDLFGYSVSLSADGSRVAIGAPNNDGRALNAGHVEVYDFNGTGWTQVGSAINGEAQSDQSGWSLSLSADGSRVAIGAPNNDGYAPDAGHVRVYGLSGNSWTQVGSDIDGEATGDYSGYSVSLSSDGSRVAIGATNNDGNGVGAGHVRVYGLSGNSWTQVGSDIDGHAAGDQSGYSVSLSSNGFRVAIGAREHDATRGHVRVFDWNGSSWTQVGSDIDGEATGDLSGSSVSLASNGSRVAIGATDNGGNGQFAGHVRVFAISPSSPSSSSSVSEASPGVPGIYLYVAGSEGRVVEGTPVYHGSAGIAPNTTYTLSVQSMGSRTLTRTVLAIGVTNGGGHIEGLVQLGALSPGSYKIVMTGFHALGYPLVLTNHISVDAAGRFVSVSAESLQPTLP